jgi:hypothetical protein
VGTARNAPLNRHALCHAPLPTLPPVLHSGPVRVRFLRYIGFMAKGTVKASTHDTAVRKSEGKPARYPKGYGALRGQFVIREGLDVTKPIFEQVLKLEKKDRRKPKQ